QVPAMKAVSGTLRLELAQYRELAAFAQFGSDLDEATRKTLARGARLVELLKQGQYQPVHVGLQVAVIYAGTKGYLDKYPIEEVLPWERGLRDTLQRKHADLLEKIKGGAKLKDIEGDLKAAIESYDKGYTPHAQS